MTTRTGTNSEELVSERRGTVLVLRLNRPEARNAMTGSLLRGIGTAALEAEADPEVRAIVLTGTGDRTFCAGMDLRDFAAGGDFSSEGFTRLAAGGLSVPVIGAANGTAIGGGLELLLGCDIIVASAAAEFGLPEIKRGLFPAGGGTALGTRIPLGIALEMTMTGDYVTADRAYQIGLVNAVVPQSDVLDVAIGLAERVAANAPLEVAACKELVRLSVSDTSATMPQA